MQEVIFASTFSFRRLPFKMSPIGIFNALCKVFPVKWLLLEGRFFCNFGKAKNYFHFQCTSLSEVNQMSLDPSIRNIHFTSSHRFPGFLRSAISDPQPERRFFRRGWVTFERNAKIKEICYSFNNIRLRLVNFYQRFQIAKGLK